MDTIFDKLGIYDFFNVILAGGTFIILGLAIFPTVYVDLCMNVTNITERGIIFLVSGYVIGLFFQEIGSVLDEKILNVKRGMTSTFLNNDNKIIDDPTKKTLYRKLAENILEDSQSDRDKYFSTTENEFVFSYCVYYIENKKRNARTEKMRALYGMSKNLMVSFGAILILLVIKLIRDYPVISSNMLISAFIICIMMRMLYNKMKRNFKYMIRMVMGTYASCVKNENIEQ